MPIAKMQYTQNTECDTGKPRQPMQSKNALPPTAAGYGESFFECQACA